MKTAETFHKREDRSIGDIFWNNKPIEILGHSTLKINEDEYHISSNLQNVFTETT